MSTESHAFLVLRIQFDALKARHKLLKELARVVCEEYKLQLGSKALPGLMESLHKISVQPEPEDAGPSRDSAGAEVPRDSSKRVEPAQHATGAGPSDEQGNS